MPDARPSDGSFASLRAAFALNARVPRWQLVLLALLMIVAGLSEGVGVMLFLPLVQAMNGGTASDPVASGLLDGLGALGLPQTLTGILLAVIALVILRAVLLAVQDYAGARVQQRLVDGMRIAGLSAILCAEWRWLAIQRRADLTHQLITELNRVGSGFQIGLRLVTTLATTAIYLAGAAMLSPAMTALALSSGALLSLGLSRLRRRAMELGRLQAQASKALQREVEGSLAGAKVAKVFGGEAGLITRLGETLEELRRRQLGFTANAGLTRTLFQGFAALMLGGYVLVGTRYAAMPLSAMLTMVLIFGRLLPLLLAGQQQIQQWTQVVPAIESVNQLLAESARAAEPLPPHDTRDWAVRERLDLAGVTYRHGNRNEAALREFSVSLAARSTIAIVGPSGAGKSTLADLLLGLIAPDAGTISVDGLAIDGGARRAWREHVALAQQDVFLFNDTIASNLRIARPQASEAELVASLHAAAADFVFRLPQGIETPVGDNGAQLSGGERQRLSLARCLLRRPALLVLDEVTSALDRTTEARVWETIDGLHGEALIVVIAHRIPAAARIDHFLVIEDGRLAAEGPWEAVRQAAGPWLSRPEAPDAV